MLAAPCFLLTACGPSVQPLIIEVRDAATHKPAAGVTVVADVPSRDHPFSVASILGQTGPHSCRAVTDPHGRAAIKYIPERPLRIGLMSADWESGFVLLDIESPTFDAAAWHTLPDPVSPPLKDPEFRVIR